MSSIWCILFLGGWLAWSGGADGPGAVIRIDLGMIDHAISTALNESDVLQKMAEEAAKKKPTTKPIKGVSGLKMKDLRPPVISLALPPGSGIFMVVLVQMTIAGKSFIGGNTAIALAANLTASSRLWQDATGIPRLSCRTRHIALVSIKTNLPSSILLKVMSKFLDSTLQKVLPGLLCPAVDAVLNLVNAKFTTMTSKIPLGTAGTLRYALLNPPVTTETFIELDLKTILHQKEGKEVDLPMDQPVASLPLKRDAAAQLILSANFLSAELCILLASFNLDISNNMVLGLPLLVTTMLGALSPAISRVLPPSQPMVIEMREAKAPVVTITLDKSCVQLFSTAEFRVIPSDSAPESLFVLDVHSNLEAQFAIAEEKLHLSLALQSLACVALASSSLGTFDELLLKRVLAAIVHVAYVPSINRVLRGGVPLPDLLGITYRRANLSGFENALVLDVPVTET
ncbi:PREDICTED: BPI fold-containing family B member 6 [Nipponia nippon]|uniref:BPI fold-containing family B member 6 n=1 Tax=Nipponia nippon TaxID=128390 RepID=UPI0005108D3E|nr:PREDICTED: BPI fold-containing family B member 6 [Nipponia nippon]